MLEVMLTPGRTGARLACLRELCGRDESVVRGTSSAAGNELLARLLVELEGGPVGPTELDDLTGDRHDHLRAVQLLERDPRAAGRRGAGVLAGSGDLRETTVSHDAGESRSSAGARASAAVRHA